MLVYKLCRYAKCIYMETVISLRPAQSLKNHYVAQKLNFLLHILQDSKKGYEQIATVMPDRSVQKAIEGLAMECGQYISELTSQISSLGAEPNIYAAGELYSKWYQTKSWETSNNDEILTACSKRENMIVKAYREVLNDPSIYKHLRGIITYQLNGMLYAFVKVKLLNTTLRH